MQLENKSHGRNEPENPQKHLIIQFFYEIEKKFRNFEKKYLKNEFSVQCNENFS